MNLYLLTQNENSGYATFDSCIVCAESEVNAKEIPPSPVNYIWNSGEWASSTENVKCELIGTAKEGLKEGVIIASYNNS